MTIGDLGEFKLIERLMAHVASPSPLGVEGIGDDCAVLPYSAHQSLVVTTDMLVENTHFTLKTISAFDLGYKSLAVNLSDIAAMGGQPLYVFLSLALPSLTSIQWVDQFFKGFNTLAHEHTVFLLGGDTTKGALVTINATVIGSIETAKIKRRSQAKIDDLICCTHFLGDSGAGLQLLFENQEVNHPLIQAHLRPRPHLKEGQWLAQQTSVHAMMDISDGIASDLQHILDASHCGAEINLDQLPLSDHLKEIAKEKQWNAEEIALTAGEDYCLLFTLDPVNLTHFSQAYQAYFHSPFFIIGTVTDFSNGLVYRKNGQSISFEKQGFNHFKSL
jgi:thiamine-monophosphate kinase